MKFGLEQHIIDKLIAVFGENPKVDKALVFGSRAKGNYRPDSDIDIALKGQGLDTDDIIAMGVAFEKKGITHQIDLVNYDTIKEPDLKDHIDRVGIELYSRWKKFKLGDVLEIKYGKDHKILSDGLIPIYGSGGIMRYGDKALYDKKSILIPRKGSLNNIFYQEEPFWTVDTMFWTKINEKKIYPKFLFYQLTTVDYTNLNVGSAVPSLTIPVIEAIDISIPPLKEQIAIASVLSCLDDKIDLLHRQNKTLEQLAETLFRQWFVEEAEEDWELEELKKYVTTVDNRGKTPPNYEIQTEYPLIEANAINGDERLINYSVVKKYVTEEIYKNWFRDMLKKYDTIITTVGANIGAMAMFVLEEGNIAQNIIGLSAKGISPFYLYQILKYKVDEIFQMDIGGVQPSLKVPHLLSLEIPIPSLELQNKFDIQVLEFVSKMEINYKHIQNLTQTRDTLLPKLMSGEVRIKIS